jgi:hypothetical protein
MNTTQPFSKGDRIEVENTRQEMLYRGEVLEVDGTKVRVSLPGAGPRPFVFDVASPDVGVQGRALFTSW